MSTAEALVSTMAANDRERTRLSLFDITNALLEIEDELYENGGEITQELEARLESLEGSLERKIDGICSMIQNNQRAAEAAKAESQRLSQLAKSRESIANGLKRYALGMLTRIDRTKVETDRFKVRVQKNGRPSITWPGEPENIPDDVKRVTITVDGDAAYALYRQGNLHEGFVVETGTHLRIS